MASLEDVALWASIAPMLIGTIFMVSAPKQTVEGFYNLEVLKGKGLSPEVGGLICHGAHNNWRDAFPVSASGLPARLDSFVDLRITFPRLQSFSCWVRSLGCGAASTSALLWALIRCSQSLPQPPRSS